MKRWFMFCFWVALLSFSAAQDTVRVMSYNLLNYPDDDAAGRNPHFRTVLSAVQPDILVVQEMFSAAGVTQFLGEVLNIALSGFGAGTFVPNDFGASAVFFRSDVFTFLTTIVHPTTLRDITEFRLRSNTSGKEITVFSVHLKASNNPDDIAQRAAEVEILRQVTDALPAGTFFIVCGDFNIYDAAEPAFQQLLAASPGSEGHVTDPLNLPGSWHNNAVFAPLHTQSTRVRLFGSGVPGGLDDRFDMILLPQAVLNGSGFRYVPDSYTTFGNDGMHFNDSINALPNQAVSPEVANALHYASDHLPVYADFVLDAENITHTVPVSAGWNLLGLPVRSSGAYYLTLFPNAQPGSMFGYEGAYVSEDTLQPGQGYWVNFPAPESVPVTGAFADSLSLMLNSGWNLISGLSCPVPLSAISDPEGILLSGTLFHFDGAYIAADTLQPGRGYWIRAAAPGRITLKCPTVPAPNPDN